MLIKDRIKAVREAKGLKQKEFGEPININLQQISKYERGEMEPSLKIVEKIATQYKINLNWLITGNGDMFLDQKPKELEKCDEVREAYMKLPADRQKYYYHKIIAESLEE